MDQIRAYALLNRQLTDILAQAERIANGSDSAEEIESFARYSIELKRFITNNIDDKELSLATKAIPDINYSRMCIQLWQYLIFPAWWIGLYKDYRARMQTRAEVNEARGRYASLQLLVKSRLY